jgi:hypothetical protein
VVQTRDREVRRARRIAHLQLSHAALDDERRDRKKDLALT